MDDSPVRLAILTEKVRALEAESENWVSRVEFAPVKMVVYGMTTLLLAGIVGAILALVIKQPLP